MVEKNIKQEYAAQRREQIDMTRAGESVEAGNPFLDQGDTIFVTAADNGKKKIIHTINK